MTTRASTSPLPSESRTIFAAGGILLLLLLVPYPASPDWLLTVDGQRIKTDGPWEVKGRRVIFTDTSGTLSSVRLSEVDLEASKRLTEQRPSGSVFSRAQVIGDDVSPKKDPVLVLKDADVGHIDPQADEDRSGTQRTGVQVASWDEADNELSSGVEIAGKLQNYGKVAAVDISVMVLLYRDRGGAGRQ